jgi:hypothetical protein
MDTVDANIRFAIATHWESFVAGVQSLSSSVDIRPPDITFNLFPFDENEQTSNFELRPVVLVLPERADHTETNLHVVVSGTISIDRDHFQEHKTLRTVKFQTRVAYFRLKPAAGVLEHVYGAHYDYEANAAAHPVFHSQVKSFADMRVHINGYDDLQFQDHLERILTRVRVPTAQMDFFSLVVQLVADHLISAASGESEIEIFLALINKSKNVQGAGHLIPRLGTEPAIQCYRAAHWYPDN